MSKYKKNKLSHKVINFIVNSPKLIGKVFAGLVIISVIQIFFVKTNYDLTKYLPASSQTKRGIEIIKKEFNNKAVAQVMVSDTNLVQIKDYVDKIEKVAQVDSVIWAGSVGQINVAEDFLEIQNLDDYYKDENSLLTITFKGDDSSLKTYEAVDEIKKIIGDKGHYTGTVIDNQALNNATADEMPRIMIFAVLVIFLILTISTSSWFEPIIFFITMGAAIIINMGSNIIFGEISFISVSVASVLQLAVAMDYSIFLLHEFASQKKESPKVGLKKIMAKTLKKITPSILASSITTIIGFSALGLMQFSIGKDLGFILAKSIFCSLLAVIFLTPILILKLNHLIEKYHHSSFLPNFGLIGKKIVSFRYLIVFVALVISIPAFFAQGMNNFMYGTASVGGGPGTIVYEDKQAIKKVFGETNSLLILIPNENIVKKKSLSDEIKSLPFVKNVNSITSILPQGVPDSILPKNILENFHSNKYARIIIGLNFEAESQFAFDSVNQIKEITKKYYPENTFFLGDTPATQDIKNVISDDYGKVNLISILGVALVVLITFKSLILTVVIMLSIETAIFAHMALPFLYGDTFIFLGFLIVSSVQLGATVDYAILLSSKYLHYRDELNNDKFKAMYLTLKNSLASVLTSGLVLATAGYGIYFLISISATRGLGQLIGRGALFSLISVTFLLPSLLMVTDFIRLKEKKLISYLPF